jgi:PAS domain S-box-containing protein
MADKPEFVFDAKLIPQIFDKMPIGITIFDVQGIMLYYNEYSTRIINRKPEHLGRDIRACHSKPQSTARIDAMIDECKKGRREPISYEARPYGKTLLITVTPLEMKGRLTAFLHTAQVKP